MKKAGRITALLCENSAWKAWVDACAQGPDAARGLDGMDGVKLPCSGKVEAGMVLKLLESGICRRSRAGLPERQLHLRPRQLPR